MHVFEYKQYIKKATRAACSPPASTPSCATENEDSNSLVWVLEISCGGF